MISPIFGVKKYVTNHQASNRENVSISHTIFWKPYFHHETFQLHPTSCSAPPPTKDNIPPWKPPKISENLGKFPHTFQNSPKNPNKKKIATKQGSNSCGGLKGRLLCLASDPLPSLARCSPWCKHHQLEKVPVGEGWLVESGRIEKVPIV